MFEKTIFWHFYNCLDDDLWQREHTFMPSCVQCTFFDTRLDKIGEIHWCIHENFESTFLCFIISFCTFDFCDEFFVSTTHFKCTAFNFLMHTILVFSTPMISCDHDFFNATIGLGLSSLQIVAPVPPLMTSVFVSNDNCTVPRRNITMLSKYMLFPSPQWSIFPMNSIPWFLVLLVNFALRLAYRLIFLESRYSPREYICSCS